MGKPSQVTNANTQRIFDDNAADCALILSDHGKGKRKHLSTSRQRACEYVIDHAIGKARQKIEHSGGIFTYGDLAKSADTLEKKPRDVLADVEELANKYKESKDATE